MKSRVLRTMPMARVLKTAWSAALVHHWGEQGMGAAAWDRVPEHRGALYRNLNVTCIEQPSCSAERNPAGRIFEHLCSKIERHVYSPLPAKQQAVHPSSSTSPLMCNARSAWMVGRLGSFWTALKPTSWPSKWTPQRFWHVRLPSFEVFPRGSHLPR